MSGFDHAAHLRFALEHLAESPSFDAAMDRVAAALQAKAADAGHPEKYHHTLTLFWMQMLARLLDKALPLEYYSRERLFSDDARRSWVEPDRLPLPENTRIPDATSSRSVDSPRDAPDRTLPR
jgi:hypothetical protein